MQWLSTMATYVYPVIGGLPVSSVDTALVVKVIEPIWMSKTETASRVRGRIESVIDWATVRGFRQGDNPARWRGHLDHLLPARSSLRRHHAALPYAEAPAFMADLRGRNGISARALEFAILTAARTGEVIGSRWSEIDFTARVWTVPAERMKGQREHRVPLSDRVLAILESLPRGSDYVFIGARAGKPLSDMAMAEMLKGMGFGSDRATVHGMRSSFRDWAADRTNYQNHIVEMALAHVVGDKVEAAYRRGDLFEKRRRLMNEWARYCTAKPARALGVVVSMKGRR